MEMSKIYLCGIMKSELKNMSWKFMTWKGWSVRVELRFYKNLTTQIIQNEGFSFPFWYLCLKLVRFSTHSQIGLIR
jgi:hypothetical protein